MADTPERKQILEEKLKELREEERKKWEEYEKLDKIREGADEQQRKITLQQLECNRQHHKVQKLKDLYLSLLLKRD